MTIIHDLTLSPEARRERRLSNLEQGYIANQQTGAWAKTIIGGLTNNATEVFQLVTNLAFTTPASGQYMVSTSLDVAQSASGYSDVQLNIEGTGGLERLVHPSALRIPVAMTYGAYIEKGKVISVLFRRFAGAGTVSVQAGELVISKIA